MFGHMHWAYLLVAIVAEVVATSALKAANGFTVLVPSLLVCGGYAAAFWCLSLALRGIPLGVAYALWSGIGLVLVSAVGWRLYGQTLNAWAILGIALIGVGVVVLSFARPAA